MCWFNSPANCQYLSGEVSEDEWNFIYFPFMDQSQSSQRLKAEVLLIIVVVIWGANYPLAKFGLSGIHPFIFNAVRYVTAAIFMWIVTVAGRPPVKVEKKDLPNLLGTGMVASVIYQVIFIIGLSMSTAGNSAVILSTSPLWTVILHAWMYREKVRAQMWIGTVLSIAGVILIILGSGQKVGFGSEQFLGDCILLVAAALWGLSTNLQKPLLRFYSATHLTLILMVIGAIGLSVIAIPFVPETFRSNPGWEFILAAVLSGAFSIGIGNLLWSFGVKVLGPNRTANFNNLVPVLALVFSYFTLHEGFLPVQFAGAAVTILGVWIARL